MIELNPAISAVTAGSGLTELQKRFALSKIGGKLRVVDMQEISELKQGRTRGPLSYFDLSDARLLMSRVLETLPVATKSSHDIQNFFRHPKTHVFVDVCYSPSQSPDDVINLWQGPRIKGQAGDWSVIKEHIREIICDCDESKFEYLIRYIAHMLQKPEEKPGVMIVLSSKQGTGKGLFFECLRRIWSSSTVFTSSIKDVVGQFNSVLENSYVLILDEAFFHGDRGAWDRMKSLITEPFLRIEAKFQPQRQVNSLHRIFASTNHRQFGATTFDDRRHLFFGVAESRVGDFNYFKQLAEAIADDAVIAAMAAELESMDLRVFNVREFPKSSERAFQVLESLIGFDDYWYQVLLSEQIDCSDLVFSVPYNFGFVSSSSLHRYAQKHVRSGPHKGRITHRMISDGLRSLCPSALQARGSAAHRDQRGFLLPELKTARKEFAKALNIEVDWECVT